MQRILERFCFENRLDPAILRFMTTLAPVEFIRQGVVASIEREVPQQAFAWTVWPARERPSRTVFAVLAMVSLGWMVGSVMNDSWIGGVAGLALVISLQRFLLPTDYVLNADGLTVHEPLRVRMLRWNDVHGVMWQETRGLLRASRDGSGRRLSRIGGVCGVEILLGFDPASAEVRRRAVDSFLRQHGS